MLIYRLMRPIFENRLMDWLTGVPGTPRPKCPDCGWRVEDVLADVGQPVRILFACGHEFRSPRPGLKRREI